MSAQTQPRLTPEQYLELERAAEFRHEYYNGRMYAMPGGTYHHVRIIANFAANLHGLLRKRPCAVLTSDMRIRVSPEGLYTYPDVVVVCGEPKFGDGRSDTLVNPTLLIEVLSPSTEAYDRGFKAEQYRKIETLKEYALVSQFSAHVEVVRRHENGRWLLSEYSGVETACQFESVDCSVALSDVYEGIPFASMEADIAHPSSFH
jgi:Uma2 family endonuclease